MTTDELLAGDLIGERVHYVSHGTPPRPDGSQAFPSVCRAAFVTEVGPPDTGPCPHEGMERHGGGCATLGIMVINPTGLFFHPLAAGGAHHDAVGAGGTWHWPGDTDLCDGGGS